MLGVIRDYFRATGGETILICFLLLLECGTYRIIGFICKGRADVYFICVTIAFFIVIGAV